MQVLIATELDSDHLDCLRASFPEVDMRVAGRLEAADDPTFSPEILFCGRLTAELLDRLPDLRWVQVRSAGVDHLPLPELARRNIILTNGSGAHGVPVAETVIAMMTAFATGLPALIRAQDRKEWVRPAVAPCRFELENQTLLVVGLGDLGSALVRKARGLGMRVVGCDRQQVAGIAGLTRFVMVNDLDNSLPLADHVALCLPLTRHTAGIMNEHRIRLMKKGAYLYNVGRGGLVDQQALIESLQRGDLAGAGLDVTDPEPLPPDSPLWSMPNVLLTQHVGGASPHNSRRVADLFSENLHRYMNGYPLLNVVDLELGY